MGRRLRLRLCLLRRRVDGCFRLPDGATQLVDQRRERLAVQGNVVGQLPYRPFDGVDAGILERVGYARRFIEAIGVAHRLALHILAAGADTDLLAALAAADRLGDRFHRLAEVEIGAMAGEQLTAGVVSAHVEKRVQDIFDRDGRAPGIGLVGGAVEQSLELG